VTNDERPWWQLRGDEDKRFLWLTFVGGLAAILVSVCVIGAAIALARFHAKGLGAQLSLLSVTVVSYYLTWEHMRRTRAGLEKRSRTWLAFLLLADAVFTLQWIGVAVGVK
jgi:hypothetical protein